MTARAWCPECRKMADVVDQHDEGEQTRAGETIYVVTDLGCGHSTETEPRILVPAPGAPYAGTTGLPVAASHRPRDLTAATRTTTDPWADQ